MGTDRIPLRPVQRPNGKLYRPRVIQAQLVSDDNEDPASVLVLGTHAIDDERVQALADACIAAYDSGFVAADPVLTWQRLGLDHGHEMWTDDPEHGRAAVWFKTLKESADGH